ncbi:MAG: hypothetical protein IAG13_04160 [Deltaproteobacteria bacterium]|nr:hypothetical protein [Nannocystaceae bacterium]
MTDDLGATIGEVTARLDAAGIPYMVVGASVEDVIVGKLEWARIDARALVELAGARLDRVYVERQVEALGLVPSWAALVASLADAT